MSQYGFSQSGGGYLAGGSPFGSGGSQSSFGDDRKTEAAHSLRPVTIGQLIRATQAHTDAEWRLEGDELSQFTTVGQVMSVQWQTTNSVYWVEDGSGRMEARKWNASSPDDDEKKPKEIVENVYVRVTGSLKVFGNKRFINTTHIRLLKDHYEVFFHTLEAISITLTLQKGAPPGPGQQNQLGDSSAYMTRPAAISNEEVKFTPMQQAIVDYMKSVPDTREGIHVAAIARHTRKEAHMISDALEALMEGGIVYTTSDEAHFRISL